MVMDHDITGRRDALARVGCMGPARCADCALLVRDSMQSDARRALPLPVGGTLLTTHLPAYRTAHPHPLTWGGLGELDYEGGALGLRRLGGA